MRVPRDIGILILWNLGLKAVLMVVYFSELTLIFIILADPVLMYQEVIFFTVWRVLVFFL